MVARVMHNFSLKDLIIINPRENWLNDKSINSAKKAAPAVELKKTSEKKEKSDKSKTVAEIDRDKLEKKFSQKKEMKPN